MGPPDGGRPIPTIKITDWKSIDHAIGALTSHVRTVVKRCEREVPASSDRRKFPPDILELIRAKTKLCASAYPTPEYRSRARALQREVKARVQESEMRVGATSWRKLHRHIKRFGNYQGAQNGGYTLYPRLKTGRLHRPRRRGAHISRIEEEVLQKTSLEPKDDLTPVSLSEVQLLVRSLKTRKAPGLDGETARPPASYRPISLLSGLAKYSREFLKLVSVNICSAKALSSMNSSVSPGPLLSTASPPLSQICHGGFKSKQKTVAVFFDVAKAFDRVWHAGLVYKLYSLQVPDRLIFIIQNFLSNRHFTFRHERTHSTRRLIRAGVPQGSALSPLLYSAYTNDIPRPSSGVQLALFADDTALFYKCRNRSTYPPSSASRGH
ncbi:Probable RNA-directed DNA polymerase from transposon X-element [Eumeta japonica]|uniref:Probable RNA-directed DNA polymerase from transposon X-element n=1 Tax=Eumeta variegata TaxID=151549 RepID=A0A4C1UTH6_EUMVA|nr:Probable RNA-directed DNA polymerase from transposon X-element [Eumeta japonica]